MKWLIVFFEEIPDISCAEEEQQEVRREDTLDCASACVEHCELCCGEQLPVEKAVEE